LGKKWESNVTRGQYIISVDCELISEEDTFMWLWRAHMKAKSQVEITAVQGRELKTRNHATNTLKTETVMNALYVYSMTRT
jgi:hypothetical protein